MLIQISIALVSYQSNHLPVIYSNTLGFTYYRQRKLKLKRLRGKLSLEHSEVICEFYKVILSDIRLCTG